MRVDPRTRVGGYTPHAADLFMDRERESISFAKSLEAHAARINSRTEDEEVVRNVLMYYGMGGVGKSTLSERLEYWVRGKLPLQDGWGPKPSTRVDASVRIDLKDLWGHFDVVEAVIAIRQELGSIKRTWPAFDFAFAAYWSASHPGDPLPTEGTSDNGFADATHETLGSVLTDLGILDTTVGVGLRSIRMIVEEIRKHKERRLAFESFDGYRDLVERCTDMPSSADTRPDLLVELTVLLAHELSTYTSSPAPLVVVFIDTVERLNLDNRRTGERRLNQLAWTMPNVLFVMTGRNMLDWYDERRTSLRVAGSNMWPGLVPGATGEPRQHLVGKLSPSDAREVILRGRDKFDLPIPDPVVDELVIASGGLPQYLDLARVVAMNAKQNGRSEVRVEDVTGSLGDLVTKVLEDIPQDERQAIRAASMFPYFDSNLVAATGDTGYGAAERAMMRPMINYYESAMLPFSMHDEIRSAIRSADAGSAGAWNGADWSQAGTRGLRELRRRYEATSQDETGTLKLVILGLAVSLVCEQEVMIDPSDSPSYSDWLSKALVFGPSINGLRTYIPAQSKTTYGQLIIDFVSAKGYEINPEERYVLLRKISMSDHPLALPAGRHLAYSLRNAGRWNESLDTFDELIERDPSELNCYQRVLTLTTARRFADAVEKLGNLPTARRDFIEANLALNHGMPHAWLMLHKERRNKLQEEGRTREYLECSGTLLRWRMLLGDGVDPSEIGELQGEAEAVWHPSAIMDCLVAAVLMAPWEAQPSVERLEVLDAHSTDGHIGYRTFSAKVATAFALKDYEQLRVLRDEVKDRKRPRGRLWIPAECLLASTGLSLPDSGTQWLEPYEEVEERWRDIFERYRSSVGDQANRP